MDARIGYDVPPAEDQVSLRAFVDILKRRSGLIAAAAAAGMALAVFIVLHMTPLYQATASLAFQPHSQNPLRLSDMLSSSTADAETLDTEAGVMRSRATEKQVIDKLGLLNDPEFNPTLGGGGSLFSLAGLKWLVAPEKKPDAALALSAAIDTLWSALDIQVVSHSYIISVSVTSPDPQKAARIANTLVEIYLANQIDTRFRDARRANAWLSQRLDELREKVRSSENAVAEYRAAHNLIGNSNGTMTAQQLAELNTQIITVRAERADKEARLAHIRGLLDGTGGFDSSAEVLASPLIQQLRAQETEVMRKLSQLSANFGDRYPKVVDARAELRELQAKIQQEVGRIAAALASEVEIAQARENALVAAASGLQHTIGDQGLADVHLRELQREADSNKALFETVLTRFKENDTQQGINQPDAHVVSLADTPQHPVSPKRKQLLGAGFFAALVGAIGLGLIRDKLDDRVHSAEEIEALGGGTVIAMIPALHPTADAVAEDWVVAHPQSPTSEAFRHLRLFLSRSPARCILFTSAAPEEGKTFAAVSFARSCALAGQRTLLIEADLYRPRFDEIFDRKATGLVQLLRGEQNLEQAIFRDRKTSLFVIASGDSDRRSNPVDLLSSPSMHRLLAGCRQAFDMIVIDSVLIRHTDARILTTMADRTVLVARWEKSLKSPIRAALKHLAQVESDLAGTIITEVDVKKYVGGGYGDYERYFGRYRGD